MSINAHGLTSRVPPQFNWVSIDDVRNFFLGVPSNVLGHPSDIPKETNLSLNGTQAGEFGNKFIQAQDHADQKAWGWSSVGPTGTNVGVWIMTNLEFSNGGPLKRDVTAYPANNINNSIVTQELGQGTDSTVEAGEVWTKVCGPWFYYTNSVPASITDPAAAAQALHRDAIAQDAAEKAAWPYSWLPSPAYVKPSGRGVVTGKIAINDSGNRDPVLSGMWVGLEQQPVVNPQAPFYDFQKWLKPYQFWTQTDAGGSFTIPNVIAGSNYTLFCFGPGAPGTFMSQNLNGGAPPYEVALPAKAFAVTVTGGQTTDLGTVNWSPKRVGATVFELGYPNRKADKYRHGEDFWAPEHSPAFGFPTPVWGGQAYYLQEFPNGVNYTVGAAAGARTGTISSLHSWTRLALTTPPLAPSPSISPRRPPPAHRPPSTWASRETMAAKLFSASTGPISAAPATSPPSRCPSPLPATPRQRGTTWITPASISAIMARFWMSASPFRRVCCTPARTR